MRRVWPPDEAGSVDRAELERLYGYPEDRSQWLAMNFVSSVDGAVEVAGRSRGLSNEADREVYPLGSSLADVILVGASTAIIEEFRGVEPDEQQAELRARHGLAPVPRIAVVTSGRSLPADAPVITDVQVPTIVITCRSAPAALREEWEAAGAEVLVAGDGSVDFAAATSALAQRGLKRIHCDGGPRLFGSLLEAGVVDELRLTLSPMLVSGTAERIAAGTGIDPAHLTLASVLAQDDTLLLRYLINR
ncbi:pyrimidine reductase family protein [Saccharopolyspora sp. TS4A08]|uniref:Pyrimidine reductase family protein n=1 Tax=Saccharopolyspora ipomoeae TaxID=3042027 RepID=A0ABT6PSW1_9PSEU|nr:pyrimidine reductase family protein [Saccharopolyspora sp. TS4A08]MDI2031099.1 pyrimidine reductase family protein [Saccharopolyspora sp. TS4A08]